MKRLTKTYDDGTFGPADNLEHGENSHAYKRDLIDALGKYEEKELKGANIPMKITADSMILGYRVGDLIAVKNMVDSSGDKTVQDVASYVRYGYKLALDDFSKIVKKNADIKKLTEELVNGTGDVPAGMIADNTEGE